jgi:two-component system LytT family response regulator
MIHTIIVEDEAGGKDALIDLLNKRCSSVLIVATCESIDAAITAIEQHKPDLVFLDVELHNSNGFILFDKIKEIDFDIIFTIAHDQYALKAIKCGATDYLVKPIAADDLVSAVAKTEKKKTARQQLPYLQHLLSGIHVRSRSAKISVPTFEGLQMLDTDDIVKCIAKESYTEIVLMDGTRLIVSRMLKEYEDMLAALNFFRIHNSYLVNLRHVKKYIKGDGGYVLMCNGETCEVSRRKKNELLNRLSIVEL